MTQRPRMSIIVPSRTGHLGRLRRDLARQAFQDWELVIKQGIVPAARARNVGAAEARGEIVVFLDDDIRLGDTELLARLYRLVTAGEPRDALMVRHVPPAKMNYLQRRLVRETITEPVTLAGELEPVSWREAATA